MAVHVDRSLRLPESEYIAGAHPKSGIAIHHTVGGSARSTFRWWQSDSAKNGRKRLVGTAYIIGVDGTVHEVFDPSAWAYQFGLNWTTSARLQFERRFIGIEIASEGGLIEHKGKLYCFDRVSPRTWKPKGEAFDYGQVYRGYRWFDRYEAAQLESLAGLIDMLCTRFSIPRVRPDNPFDYYGDRLARFEGVIGHAMVRPDKSDPAPDHRLWDTLKELTAMRPTPVAPSSHFTEELFTDNTHQIDAMDVAAGSLVKALLMELERRNTYIRLARVQAGTHTIGYEVLQGDRREVLRLARALGFATVTDTTLEVHGG